MSLLLDARKKVERALEQSGVPRAVEPRLSETLRLDDSPAGGRDVRDLHHATTQRAANLFAAKAAPARTGGRLGIIPIAIISGLVLAAGGGYYVWRETSPPPVVQRQNPAPAPRPPEGRVSDETASQSTRLANNANQVAGYGGTPFTEAAPATPVANAILPAVPAAQTAAPAPAALAAESTHAQANAGTKQSNRVPVIATPSTQAAPHDIAVQPIHIEHTQESNAVDPTLLAAYQAYRKGDLRTAWQHYDDVLHKDAKNRDALLGMAAIAQQQSQDAIAARYYGQVLMLDPRDPVANAGMSALLGASDEANMESRLKLLLAQQSHTTDKQSIALYFALGNLYAEQSRWGDAQQAYFNAYNLEQSNAQLAFNLAVSLDHLGQGKLAAQHYQRALQLDLSDNAGFNRAKTQQRINELTAP